jgi:hypothetical protein
VPTCFRFTLAFFACAVSVFCLPAVAQVLDATQPLQYVPLDVPCRAVDTRDTGTPIPGGTFRNFSPGSGGCHIDTPAGGPIAYALNVTALPRGPLDTLTIWPAGQPQPVASTLNSYDGRIKANAAMVAGGANGQISVFMSNTADLILDVSGYFVIASTGTATDTFTPLTPCRVVDTRNADGPFGGPFLAAGRTRDFVFSLSSCHIPPYPWDGPGALSLNVTVIPRDKKLVGHVTVWGTSPRHPVPPLASTINDPTGTVVANAAIVTMNPPSIGGVSVFTTDDTDIAIDVNGYFSWSILPGGLSLYTMTPCRILDTRLTTPEGIQGEHTIPVTTGNNCSVSGAGKAYVFNATVLPIKTLGFLTLWQDGLPRPTASTLNAEDGAAASNMAIVGTTNGSIDAFADLPTQLILDVSGYFAP